MRKRRNPGREVHGILLLDKPGGLSSNQALQRVKRLYGAAKAGHTGSLDPLATGMLPICFGEATKVSSYLLGAGKSYAVRSRLGVATDSGDADGRVIAEVQDAPTPDQKAVRNVLARFIGDLEQVPPMHSALKHGGKRLYELARQGLEVHRPPRSVHISAIELLELDGPRFSFTVSCSKGTYIRTLVEDIAKALGTLGHVTGLRRTAVEPFAGEEMVTQEVVEDASGEGPECLDGLLLPVDRALSQWPRLVLPAELCGLLSHGQPVAAEPGWPRSWVRLYSPEEEFFGIGEVRPHGELAPRRIFPALTSWS